MSDFASSAMLRVLHAGMRRLGLSSPAQAWLQSAKVPLDAKRQLVGQVLAERGWAAVLRLGAGVQDIQGEVILDYLTASAEPMHILQAWLRLERYVHSRHRLRLTELGSQHVQMHHYSLIEGQMPSPAEDVVVLGVLLGLLERSGLQGLEFSWNRSSDAVSPSAVWLLWGDQQDAMPSLQQALSQGNTAHWQIRWSAQNPSASGVQHKIAIADLTNMGPWAEKVAGWTAQQLLRSKLETLNLEQAAHALALSDRSLQRHLQAEGLRFVDVLGQVRVNLAAVQLRQKHSQLAEIGFSCGFADQAHFCREFKRRIGMSPLQFRERAAGNQQSAGMYMPPC